MPSYTVGFTTFGSTGVGDAAWGSPSNAATLNGVFAGAVGAIGAPSTSRTLTCKGPVGLSIPANEVVTGLAFTVYRKASHSTAGSNSRDLNVNPIVGGAIQTGIELANTALAWPTTITGATYDASATLATPGVALDSGFGIALRASMIDGDFIGSDCSVDYVTLTVTTIVACSAAEPFIRPPFAFGRSL
jgi:hypothetical protein